MVIFWTVIITPSNFFTILRILKIHTCYFHLTHQIGQKHRPQLKLGNFGGIIGHVISRTFNHWWLKISTTNSLKNIYILAMVAQNIFQQPWHGFLVWKQLNGFSPETVLLGIFFLLQTIKKNFARDFFFLATFLSLITLFHLHLLLYGGKKR